MGKWSAEDIAIAVLTTRNQPEAAQQLCRSLGWLRARLQDPDVQEAMERVRQQMRQVLVTRWTDKADELLDTMYGIATDPSVSVSNRINAARLILDNIVKLLTNKNMASNEDVEIV
jgi:hypothetical protein